MTSKNSKVNSLAEAKKTTLKCLNHRSVSAQDSNFLQHHVRNLSISSTDIEIPIKVEKEADKAHRPAPGAQREGTEDEGQNSGNGRRSHPNPQTQEARESNEQK
jgi:hypothetical protein